MTKYFLVMQKKQDLMKIKNKDDFKYAFRIWCMLYFQTNVWDYKRRLVIYRAKGICESCFKRKISDIHHLNYESLGQERLDSLLGVCRECHKELHKPSIK